MYILKKSTQKIGERILLYFYTVKCVYIYVYVDREHGEHMYLAVV